MANGDKMARSEAAKKADQRYKAEKTKLLVIRFYPADADILEHLQGKDSKQGYIKRLIREDMAKVAGYTRMPDGMRNAAAAAISAVDRAEQADKAKRIINGENHGQEQD